MQLYLKGKVLLMRKIQLYVVYDCVAELFHDRFIPAHNDNDAKRGFGEGINQKGVRYQDLSLYWVGEYDRVEGTIRISNTSGPKLIITGLDMKRKVNEDAKINNES